MATYPDCKFYIEGGKCKHIDAPNPYHSWCIGKDSCDSWNDDINSIAPVYTCDTCFYQDVCEISGDGINWCESYKSK